MNPDIMRIPQDLTADPLSINADANNGIVIVKMIAGSAQPFSVAHTNSAGGTIPPGVMAPGIYKRAPSPYVIDFVLLFFDRLIIDVLKINPDATKNNNFNKFIAYVYEMRRIIDDMYTNDKHTSLPPFAAVGSPEVAYGCDGTSDLHHHLPPDEKAIVEIAIAAGALDPKKFNYRELLNQFTEADTHAHYIDPDCDSPGPENLLRDVVFPAWGAYVDYTKDPEPTPIAPRPNNIEQLSEVFHKQMTDVNNAIKNDDYENRYILIKRLLKNSTLALSMLTSAANTNFHTVMDTSNVPKYYENLSFKENDIDGALVLPPDTDDLVLPSKIKDGVLADASKITDITTSSISSIYEMKYAGTSTNITQRISQLLATMSGTKDVPAPDKIVEELSETRMYIDPVSKKTVAKPLDKAAYKVIVDNINAENNKYVDRISDTGDNESRLKRYNDHYEVIQYGGKKKVPKKYQLTKPTSKIIFDNQTGGGKQLNITALEGKLKTAKQTFDILNDQILNVDKIYRKQNETFFENKDSFDIANIEQKNYYLMDMFNAILFYTNVIGVKSIEHHNFFESMDTIVKNYREQLDYYWDIMSQRNVMDATRDDALKKLLSNGALSADQVKDLLVKSKIDTIPIKSTEPLVDKLQAITTIKSISDGFGTNSIANIQMAANAIRSAFTTSVNHIKKLEDTALIFRELNNAFENINTINNSLKYEYNNLKSNVVNITKMKEFTSNVLDANLTTAETYINMLTTLIENFNIKVDLISQLLEDLTNSARRLDNLRIYLKRAKTLVLPYKSTLDESYMEYVNAKPKERKKLEDREKPKEHEKLKNNNKAYASNNFTNDYVTHIYKHFVDDYLVKLLESVSNVTQYYGNDAKKNELEEYKNMIKENKIIVDLIICATRVLEYEGGVLTEMRVYKTLYPPFNPGDVERHNYDLDAYGIQHDVTNFLSWFVHGEYSFFLLNPYTMNALNVSPRVENIIFMCSVVSQNAIHSFITKFFRKIDHKDEDKDEDEDKAEDKAEDSSSEDSDSSYYESDDDPEGDTGYDYDIMHDIPKYSKVAGHIADYIIKKNNTVADTNIFTKSLKALCTDDHLKRIRDNRNKLIIDETYKNIKSLLNSILYGLNNYTVNEHAVRKWTNEVLTNMTKSKTPDDATLFYKQIIIDIDTVTMSVFQLFYNLLSQRAKYLEGLSLINKSYSASYPAIAAYQMNTQTISKNINNIVILDSCKTLEMNSLANPFVATNMVDDGDTDNMIRGFRNISDVIDDTLRGHLINIRKIYEADMNDPLLDRNILAFVNRSFNQFNIVAKSCLNKILKMMQNGDIDVVSNGEGNKVVAYLYDTDGNGNIKLGFPFKFKTTIGNSAPIAYANEVTGSRNYDSPEYNCITLENNAPYHIAGSRLYVGTPINIYSVDAAGDLSINDKDAYNRVVEIPEIKLEVVVAGDANYTENNISDMIVILNSLEFALKCITELQKVHTLVRHLTLENSTTWETATTSDTPLFSQRNQKKNTLLYVFDAILATKKLLDSTNPDSVMKFSEIYDKLLFGNKIDVTREGLKSFDPTANIFNYAITDYWIYIRRVLGILFSTFSYFVRHFIVNNMGSKIVKAIKDAVQCIADGDFKDHFDKGYKKLIKNNTESKPHIKTVINEIDNAITIIDTNKTKNDAKFAPPTHRDTLSFGTYYCNKNDPSSDIYILFALINNGQGPKIRRLLVNLSDKFSEMVRNLGKFSELVSADFLYDTLRNHATINHNPDRARDYAINDIIRVITSSASLLKAKIAQIVEPPYIHHITESIDLSLTDAIQHINNKNDMSMPPPPRFLPNNNNNASLYSKKAFSELFTNEPPNVANNYKQLAYNLYRENTSEKWVALYDYFCYIMYMGVANVVQDMFIDLGIKIKSALVAVGETLCSEIYGLYNTYINTKNDEPNTPEGMTIRTLLRDTEIRYYKLPVADEPNFRDKIKYFLIDKQTYMDHSSKYDDIDTVIDTVTSNCSLVSSEYYNKEIPHYEKSLQLSNNNKLQLYSMSDVLIERNQTLAKLVKTIGMVMFSEKYREYPFLEKKQLLEKLSNAVNSYEKITTMTTYKLYDIINNNGLNMIKKSQVVNYITFKMILDKTIKGTAFVEKIYKRMSFGLIEYYKDILTKLLHCLESRPVNKLSNIELFLYNHYYIQCKRCMKLFEWLMEDYLPLKKEQYFAEKKAALSTASIPPKHILNKKIEPFSTSGDALQVFAEFQGLRKFLDQYAAVAMDRVQLHLRLNDFVSSKVNTGLDRYASPGVDYSFMKDYDPESQEYMNRWNKGEFLFENKDDPGKLVINFDLVDKINNYKNKPKDLQLYYHEAYTKSKQGGIPFERIYNRLTFPDSDVISNYMSIAPNINSGKGTVIMTYGYSGVGKSVSLFGRPPNHPAGHANGILQATFDQFNLASGTTRIYFRVFEIYGLGTQYGYYWNPGSPPGSDCYPVNSQYVIHHVLDDTGPILRSTDTIAFTNRSDILSYVLNSQDPAVNSIVVQGTDLMTMDPNLGTRRTLNTNPYFNAAGGTVQMINSSYVQLSEFHYKNFPDFVDSVEKIRSVNGKRLMIKKILKHRCLRVKPTVNNPESSRSILVYDFEIIDTSSGTPMVTPFLIYDLPGKEDIYRTFVENVPRDTDNPEAKAKKLSSPIEDKDYAIKSTYITNPILAPIFRMNLGDKVVENIEFIIKFMQEISAGNSDATAHYAYTSDNKGRRGKINNRTWEEGFVDNILNYQVTNFGFPNSGEDNFYVADNTPYRIRDLYIASLPANPTLFDLFDATKIDETKISNKDEGVINYGIPTPYANNYTNISNDVLTLVAVVTMAFLIKEQLFDIVVEIISAINNGGVATDDPSGSRWSRGKIYSFFEAYYINENVVGLLQYLIHNILNKGDDSLDTGITRQANADETMSETINKSYKISNRVTTIRALKNSNTPVNNYYAFELNPLDIQNTGNPLIDSEITKFMNSIDATHTDLEYIKQDDPSDEAYNKILKVLAFENKGRYDSNRIFRDGKTPCYGAASTITDPNDGVAKNETNKPLIQDLLAPYEKKLAFYYVFYVASNGQVENKAEEQIKLINNSMPFIGKMDPATKKDKCGT